jgi:glycosyltransferase involved in cell wall biosynthesis
MANNQAKVLIFSTAYLPLVGGAEIAVKEITDRLDDFEFDLITARIKLALPGFEKQGRLNIYRVGPGWGSLDKFLMPITGLLKAIQLNKKRNYQLIWSIMASQAGVAASLFKIFYPAKKMLLTLQEGDLEEHLKRYVLGIDFLYGLLIKPWHLLPFRQADYITAISRVLKKRAQDNKVKAPIEVIPNGVDIEKFRPGFNPLKLKKELGIRPSEKVIVTVSRLVGKNAIDDLIRAGQYLDFPFRILIVGSGLDEKKLKELVRELKLEDKVLFLGSIEHNILREYISLADVFVRPSLSEGLGNVFLEAMACGVPIIGTKVGGIPDFLKDRKTGLFCQTRSPQSIAEKIKEVFSDDELRKSLVKNGLELIRSGPYNWPNIALKMRMVYKRLL